MIKHILALIFLNTYLMTCSAQNPKNMLELILIHTTTEKSKDSHRIDEHWILKGENLTYSKTFSGRSGSKKQDKKQQRLSEKQIKMLQDLIAEKGLSKNVPSPKYAEFKIPYVAIHTNLAIEIPQGRFVIDLYKLAKLMPQDFDYQAIKTLIALLNSFFEQ